MLRVYSGEPSESLRCTFNGDCMSRKPWDIVVVVGRLVFGILSYEGEISEGFSANNFDYKDD